MAERYPLSLNAVNVVCFKIDWDERALKVLLIKRNITPQKNKWSLPGGFVNIDETVEDAALRKFVEETGIAPSYLSPSALGAGGINPIDSSSQADFNGYEDIHIILI